MTQHDRDKKVKRETEVKENEDGTSEVKESQTVEDDTEERIVS